MKKKLDTKKLVLISSLIAVAMVMSRIEALVPIFDAIIPGYKIGLANVATLFALYTLGLPYAILVSVFRVFLTFLLFPKFEVFLLSLSGAALALASMILLKKLNRFSTIGVSVVGAIAHNIGQIIAACLLYGTNVIAVNLFFLVIIATITGVLIGILSGMIIKRLKKYI